jgi:hypothetical protein
MEIVTKFRVLFFKSADYPFTLSVFNSFFFFNASVIPQFMRYHVFLGFLHPECTEDSDDGT